MFFSSTTSPVDFLGINGPFWSLAVEVQLYLLYPLLRAIKHRAGWQGVSWLLAR